MYMQCMQMHVEFAETRNIYDTPSLNFNMECQVEIGPALPAKGASR
jgi:hypothetical protein